MKHTFLTYDPGHLEPEERDEREQSLQLDANRQAYLEYLYEKDGRHDPAHPMHGLWTGLAVKHKAALTTSLLQMLGAELYDTAVGEFHLNPSHARFFEGRRSAATAADSNSEGAVSGPPPAAAAA